jgi:hypothetical protein
MPAMNLSVFRQQTPMFQLELAACIKAATTQQDVDLILKLAVPTEKSVLIGLDALPALSSHTRRATKTYLSKPSMTSP